MTSSSVRDWLLQSPPAEWASQQLHELILGALRQGPVPQHVAFVMDGNRRYARSHHKEVIEGHNLGFEALARTLEVCYKIGVKVVTVYAFSIENFKRTKYEVNALMDMAKVKLSQMAQHGDLLERYGAKIQFLGQREMIRPDVLEAIDRAIEMTSGNSKATLNICAPYTSRDEITMAIRNTVSDFSEPIRPPLKRPFSETHIARNICAQKLSTVAENNDSTSTIAPTELESGSEDMRLDDYTYKPTSPDAAKGFNAMLKLVAKILSEAADEHTATADDLVIEGASNSIIFYMKDETLSNEAKLAEVNEILDADVSNIQLAKLQNYADRLDDYAPPLDQTDASGSTTLNSRRTSSPVPQNYPDPEAITETTLTAHTFTGLHSPPLDLLVRTSGVERLSDFMLWQCHQDTDVAFLKCLWPEFSLWHFLPVILEWQWKRRKEKVWTESHGHAKRD